MGLAWLFIGSGSNSGVSASLASLGAAPGIAPPDYAYLDNAQVALYLGQLQGGIAKSEDLTQQLTQSRNAGVSLGGNSLGGSTGSSATAERVVTPTATARFYQLLDLLGRDGFLHTIDATAPIPKLREAFAKVPEGAFVKLQRCQLLIPTYVQLEQISRTAGANQSPFAEYLDATAGLSPAGYNEIQVAKAQAHRTNHIMDSGSAIQSPRTTRRLGRAIEALDKVGSDPRVPLASCDGTTAMRPHGVDLLFPMRLANLSTEQSLLAGPVTLVGKLVRAVRVRGQEYFDSASFAMFSGPTQHIDTIEHAVDGGFYDELVADTVVLAPGAVILPIAIYK